MTDPTLRRLALRTLLAAFTGTELPGRAADLVAAGLGGYALFGYNIVDRPQVASLVGALRDVRADVIVAIDEEGGDVTRLGHATGSAYPGNAALGVVDDVSLTRAVHRAIGVELASLGVTLDMAPTVDVNTADDNPVIGTRSFGADPARVAAHAAAAVDGLQEAGVAACAKHFPGHGATITDSHHDLPVIDAPLDVLRRRDLPPFAAAIEAGVRAVMTAHIRVPAITGDLPATLSPAALGGLLRGELGFDGVIVSDALEMRGASGVLGLPETAVRTLAAGCDLLCIGGEFGKTDDAYATVEAIVDALVAAVRDGRLPAERLEDAAARVALLAAAGGPCPGCRDVVDSRLGLDAARRALRVEGVMPNGGGTPLVVHLESPPTIAAGEVPWGLTAHVHPDDVVRVPAGADGEAAAEVMARAGARPVVVVSRDTHRHGWARSLVEKLTAAHPEVVLVEMGWPASWRPAGLHGYVATYGAARVNGQAAAERVLHNHQQ